MMNFDDLLREGDDSAALVMLAEELHKSGKIEGARYDLLKRAAAYAVTSKSTHALYEHVNRFAENLDLPLFRRNLYTLCKQTVGIILDEERRAEFELDK
ncbi:hypothetical protein FACS189499_03610 [Clostridia bacterium]|nr:hypothetical protein FACS189499_03610 [Clostridia bacterium]